MKADIELWTRLWKNGTKGLIIAFIAFVASVVMLAASIVYAIAARPDVFAPLENPSPQHVVNPVARQGGYVEVKGRSATIPIRTSASRAGRSGANARPTSSSPTAMGWASERRAVSSSTSSIPYRAIFPRESGGWRAWM